jgi:hypothetical protein
MGTPTPAPPRVTTWRSETAKQRAANLRHTAYVGANNSACRRTKHRSGPNGTDSSITSSLRRGNRSARNSATEGTLTLRYSVTRWNGEKHSIVEPIRMVTTKPNYGGIRWRFACPLIVRGVPCNRRALKLYKPPAGLYFGCRHCHDNLHQQPGSPPIRPPVC